MPIPIHKEKAVVKSVSLPESWWSMLETLSPGNRSVLIQDAVRPVLEQNGLLVPDAMAEFNAVAREFALSVGPDVARAEIENALARETLKSA